jgi:hypothetical protein
MLIYAPNNDAEFASVLGGLTDEQFVRFQERLGTESPTIRFIKELDEGNYPEVFRFTLKVHQADRGRAMPAIHEVMEQINPTLSQIEQEDQTIAALIRQMARANEAKDLIASDLMKGYLCNHIEYLVGRLTHRAKIEWAVDLWTDGISSQVVQLVPPLEAELRGIIWARRTSDGSQGREPFEAFLRASAHGPALEQFIVRFGDRSRLALEGVVKTDFEHAYQVSDWEFSVCIGSGVPHREGQIVNWAFEFTKMRRKQ